VKHFASRAFWSAYRNLPDNIRALADKNFVLLKSDPRHSSLHFKQIWPLSQRKSRPALSRTGGRGRRRTAVVLDRFARRLRRAAKTELTWHSPPAFVRAAIQNATSVAALPIITEAMIAELPKKGGGGGIPPGDGMGGMDF
jgi:hypothetical protein